MTRFLPTISRALMAELASRPSAQPIIIEFPTERHTMSDQSVPSTESHVITELQAAIVERDRNIADLEAANVIANNNILHRDVTLQQIASVRDAFEAVNFTLQHERDSLLERNTNQMHAIEQDVAAINRLEAINQQQTTRIQQQAAELIEALQNRDSVRGQMADVDQELTNLKTMYETLSGQYHDLRAANANQLNRLHVLVRDHDTLFARKADTDKLLGDALTNWAADIETINAELADEAQTREWCGDFDRFVERTNSKLKIPLAGRNRQYQFAHEYTVTIYGTFTAPSQDAADEIGRQLYNRRSEGAWFQNPTDYDDDFEHDGYDNVDVRWSVNDKTVTAL